MKPSFLAPLSIPLFIISILFFHQIPFTDAQKGKIETVCAQTEALKSDPRGSLKTFVIIALEKALSMADGLKGRCPNAYARLVNHLGDAIQRLQNGQIPMAILSVMAAISDVSYCYHTSILAILNIALSILKLLK